MHRLPRKNAEACAAKIVTSTETSYHQRNAPVDCNVIETTNEKLV